MAWSAPSAADVLSEFTADEQEILDAVQGVETSSVAAILGRVVAEVRDSIRSGGYALADGVTTLPLGLHGAAIDLTRWRWLISVPALKALQTDARKKAAEDSLKKLEKIAAQEWAVEPPTEGATARSGCWNSENKLVMRTHPVPPPGLQRTPADGQYANDDAPEDRT
jgi:hypothetical protein